MYSEPAEHGQGNAHHHIDLLLLAVLIVLVNSSDPRPALVVDTTEDESGRSPALRVVPDYGSPSPSTSEEALTILSETHLKLPTRPHRFKPVLSAHF